MSIDPRSSSKKTEMIEVRISHETKRDFIAACRKEGRTASEVICQALDAYIKGAQAAPSPEGAPARAGDNLVFLPRPLRRKRYLAIVGLAIGVSALAALPSVAEQRLAAACDRFSRLDTNHDGQLTYREFEGR